MKLSKTVSNIPTQLELKRIASAYVIDYKNLDEAEIRKALLKTAPQYYYDANVQKALQGLFMHSDRSLRVLSRILIKEVLLNQDNYLQPKKETEDEVIEYQQSIIDRSNLDLFQKNNPRCTDLELFHFLVETAWENDDLLSVDEQRLIEKVRERMKITETEFGIIEAKLGRYPKAGNELNTRGEIEDARRALQAAGLLFSIRNDDGTDFDVIPEEVALSIRRVLGIEIKRHGYRELLAHKCVRSKAYYLDILGKCEIAADKRMTVEELQTVIIEQLQPSKFLGGLTPRDGVEMATFRKWCEDLKLPVSGTKSDYIERITTFYDNLFEKSEDVADPRELLYQHYERFATRDLAFCRGQQLIDKDIDCERKFEEATNYLFQRRLHHKPLKLIGSSHADGILSYQDKVILWDNKSKENPVHLKDHLKQFQGYIQTSERPVAGFWVIGPDFTPESIAQAMQLTVESGTPVTLIKAADLKEIAERWEKKSGGKTDDPFPLGYLIQPGILNTALVAAI